jgi:hypothetical protein
MCERAGQLAPDVGIGVGRLTTPQLDLSVMAATAMRSASEVLLIDSAVSE